ncbi:MAG: hypothetical protein GXP55_19995 [Deltaproteobacteria bacterium]|nr:hypothetical protein [Deltaproteobacteria bacterium]
MSGWRSRVVVCCVCVCCAAIASCSVVASFPDVRAEDDAMSCQNRLDDDLNGRLDCAELSCADFCPVADAVRPANLVPCYEDSERSLSFVAQLGDLTQDARCSPWIPNASGIVGPPSCPEGELSFPGESGCAPLGAACPEAGTWPSDVPVGALHVLSGAPPGGSGAADRPFSTLAEALAVARDGDTLIVGEGLYMESIALSRSITLRGVCADKVHISSEGEGVVVRLSAPGAALRDVTLGLDAAAPSPLAGVVVEATDTRLDSLAISGVAGTALRVVDGASVVAERLDVAQLRGADSLALDVEAGASAQIHGWSARQLEGDALRVAGVLELEASWLADVDGVGLRVIPGSQTRVAGFATLRTAGGVLDVDCGGQVDACLVAEDLWSDADGGPGVLLRGGSMELRRAFIQRAEGVGVHVLGGMLVTEDLVVTQVRSRGVVSGAALRVEAAGTVRGSRILLRLNLLYGIEVLGGSLLISDLMVDGRVPSGTSAVGLRIEGGTTSVQAFSIDQAGICGVELVGVEDAVLRQGVVSKSPRGVCVDGGDLTPGELMSFIKFTSDVQRPVFVEGE